jgi:hypothetical protein
VLNVHEVHDVRQTDIHTAEPLVLEPSRAEVEIAIGKLKSYKAGGETLCSHIHKIIRSIWNKEELPQQWKESIIVPVYKNFIIMEESPSYLLPTKCYPTFFWPG